MKNDRFLIALLAVVGLLVITAVALFLLRKETREYGTDDTPEGVVRNYIIAIHNQDFDRAYGYLHESPQKPDYNEFRQPFLGTRLDTSDVSVRITDTKISGDEAIVNIVLTYGRNRPFQGSWNETGSALLVLEDENWKLEVMPHPYWGWDWYP